MISFQKLLKYAFFVKKREIEKKKKSVQLKSMGERDFKLQS